MPSYIKKHLIFKNSDVKTALGKLDELGHDAILFVIDDRHQLVGSLTDGDIRRGLIKGRQTNDSVSLFIQKDPKFIRRKSIDIDEVIKLRKEGFKLIPIVDDNLKIFDILNFRIERSLIPADVVIMAGGRGERLRPLTDKIPKPLLKIGEKTIIEHNVHRLIKFGFQNFTITLGYLADLIKKHLGDGKRRNISIDYIIEDQPLGTIGSVGDIKNIENDHLLITNSDLLTDLDYEDFFLDCVSKNADMSVVSIPYSVHVPYAVIQSNDERISSLVEKPTYTYYSNGGIYLVKKEFLNLIPKGISYNATDLIEKFISKGLKVVSYSFTGYWLDIGRHEDYQKAQKEIYNLQDK